MESAPMGVWLVVAAKKAFDKPHITNYNLYVHGPVAQLGAHHIRIVGVGSSNLLRSTKTKILPSFGRIFCVIC